MPVTLDLVSLKQGALDMYGVCVYVRYKPNAHSDVCGIVTILIVIVALNVFSS